MKMVSVDKFTTVKRGPKLGPALPVEIFDNIQSLLGNGSQIAKKCHVSSSLVAHWRKTGRIPGHHLIILQELVNCAPTNSSAQVELRAHTSRVLADALAQTPKARRRRNHLNARLMNQKGNAPTTTKTSGAVRLSTIADLDLLKELGRRGWKISALLKAVTT